MAEHAPNSCLDDCSPFVQHLIAHSPGRAACTEASVLCLAALHAPHLVLLLVTLHAQPSTPAAAAWMPPAHVRKIR